MQLPLIKWILLGVLLPWWGVLLLAGWGLVFVWKHPDLDQAQLPILLAAGAGLLLLPLLLLLVFVRYLGTRLQQRERALQQQADEVRRHARDSLKTIALKNLELSRARQIAQEANRAKSGFLASISHEIRTPLNSLIGFSNLLVRSSFDPRQQEYISHIQGAAETLLGIVNDLLDLSKVEAGMMVFRREPVDLRQLLDDVLVLLRPQAHRQQLDLLGIVYDDVPARVEADALRIKQLLTNLVSNALKFTREGEVVVRICLDEERLLLPGTATDESSVCWLRFSVTDTGIGLDEQQRTLLFRAFSQVDTPMTSQVKGTGLGLAICKQLVQQAGGDIDVQSRLGAGSTFWFSLPLPLLAEAEEAARWLDHPRLLLLESHEANRQYLRHLLDSWGAKVVVCQTPESLQLQARQLQPDGVVIGLNEAQAGQSPWLTCLDQLQQDAIPCLLLLNSSNPALQVDLRRRVGQHLYLKPVTRQALRDALQLLLHLQHQEVPRVARVAGSLVASGLLQRQIQVLAVDDTPSNLLLLSALLEDQGLSVTTAGDAATALDLAGQQAFDLVMLDIQMPGMTGDQLAARLRQLNEHYRQVPILALTAHALESEQADWLAAGINEVLIKPLHEASLVRCIHQWLGQSLLVPERQQTQGTDAQAEAPVQRALGIYLAAGRPDLADELLELLLNSLEKSRFALEQALKQQDDKRLLEAAHRLHGATRYCGVADLAQAVEQLESRLKAGQKAAALESLEQTFNEIERLLAWQEHSYYRGWHAAGV